MMPKPTPEKLAEMEATPIRLRCGECNCELDGIAEIPPGWVDVDEIRPLGESLTTYEDGEVAPRNYSAFDWETHIGTCPECSSEQPKTE